MLLEGKMIVLVCIQLNSFVILPIGRLDQDLTR